MPIKGLTDRGAALPRIGILRKGAPKNGNRPGVDLPYFRFVSDYPEVEQRFRDIYKDKPTEIRLMFISDDLADVFEAWREHWVAGGLKHRCDGETVVLWQDKNGQYKTTPRPCEYAGLPEKDRKCKVVGRLSAILPDLERIATVTVLTTSKHDIMSLQESLEAALWYQDGHIKGIPFVLTRKEREISTPTDDGKRARRKKSLLTIEPAHRYAVAALRAAEVIPLMLPTGQANETDDDEEDDRIVDAMTGEIVCPSEDHGKPEPLKATPKPAAVVAPTGWPDIPESFTSTGKLSEWIVRELKIAPAEIWKEIAAATNSRWSKPTEVTDRADLVLIATALRGALCQDPNTAPVGMPEPPEEGEFEEPSE